MCRHLRSVLCCGPCGLVFPGPLALPSRSVGCPVSASRDSSSDESMLRMTRMSALSKRPASALPRAGVSRSRVARRGNIPRKKLRANARFRTAGARPRDRTPDATTLRPRETLRLRTLFKCPRACGWALDVERRAIARIARQTRLVAAGAAHMHSSANLWHTQRVRLSTNCSLLLRLLPVLLLLELAAELPLELHCSKSSRKGHATGGGASKPFDDLF